jgi:O-acetyl-ADP-ribose deacetylase (regulator of RNase III)
MAAHVSAPAKEHRCYSCGADWSAGEFGTDCRECDGGALQRPCPICGGECGRLWQRAISDSHDAALGHWAGSCALRNLDGAPKVPPLRQPRIVDGDLLEQPVEVIVNAWNRNIIPWWLLLPQGVSGAIKKRAGYRPFIEVGRAGPIPLGGAVLTSAGRLPLKGIIHVAGINMLWRASPRSIQGSVRSAMQIVRERGFASVAFPLIGAGSGGYAEDAALQLMLEAFAAIDYSAQISIVRYRPQRKG